MLRRDRLTLWCDLHDDYHEPMPEREACVAVTLVCSALLIAGLLALCWVVGCGESLALSLFR